MAKKTDEGTSTPVLSESCVLKNNCGLLTNQEDPRVVLRSYSWRIVMHRWCETQ